MLYFLLILILLVQVVLLEQTIISYSQEGQSIQLFQYFHKINKGFYVDIGAIDPIQESLTNGLIGWDGINIQLDVNKHKKFMTSRPNQINLYFAISNNQLINKSSNAVQQISLSNLCHDYYPRRLQLLSFNTQINGINLLQSNDWQDMKCKPEIIVIYGTKNQQKNKTQTLLKKYQYSLQKDSSKYQIHIHSSKLQQYKKVSEQGKKKLLTMRLKHWFSLFHTIFREIVPKFITDFEKNRSIDSVTSPIFLHFSQQRVISINKLKRLSKSLSNTTRPILILNYNPLYSKLLLETIDYKLKTIKLQSQILYLFEINYTDQKIQVYILDHQFDSKQPLNILDNNISTNCEKYGVYQKIVNVDNYIK